MTGKHLLYIAAISLLTQDCKPRRELSEEKHIIVSKTRGGDRHDGRFTVENPAAQFPFILISETGCTSFIIDVEKGYALTAFHCSIIDVTDKTKSPVILKPKLCYDLKQDIKKDLYDNLDFCKYPAKITQVLDYSIRDEGPNGGSDFILYKYEWTGPVKPIARAIKISSSRDDLLVARQGKLPIQLVGYPADNIQQAKLTRSECVVKSDLSQSAKMRERLALLSQFNPPNPKNSQVPAEQVCFDYFADFFGISVGFVGDISQTRFTTDCSVWGGNSGGPYIVNWQGEWIALGMPATYIPDKKRNPADEANLESYRKKFAENKYTCKSVYDRDFRSALGPEPWNEIEEIFSTTSSYALPETDTARFLPKGIPLADQIQSSTFLKANGKRYMKSLVPGLEDLLNEQQRLDEISRALREESRKKH